MQQADSQSRLTKLAILSAARKFLAPWIEPYLWSQCPTGACPALCSVVLDIPLNSNPRGSAEASEDAALHKCHTRLSSSVEVLGEGARSTRRAKEHRCPHP